MDKRLIAERFARARDTYSREARVQQQVAEKMLRLLTEHTSLFHRIVEFGCGTGSYSRLLLDKLQPESLLLNDLCPEMRECLTDLLPVLPCNGSMIQRRSSPVVIVSCRKRVIWLLVPLALKICAKSTHSQAMDLSICR